MLLLLHELLAQEDVGVVAYNIETCVRTVPANHLMLSIAIGAANVS
jgi:hypothetical protein